MALVRSTCAQEATDLRHPHDHDDAMAVMALVPSTPAQEAMELHPHGHSEAMAIMRLVPSTSAQEAHHGDTHQSIEFESPNHHGHTQQAIKFRSPTYHQAPNYHRSANHHSHGRQTAMEFQSPHHNPSPKYHSLAQQAMEFPTPIPRHHHEFQTPAYHRHGQEAMEFPSPNNFHHGSSVKDHDLMWRPGSPAYMASSSSGREHMDRLRCKQELQKLYEETSESSYDLSLKDIVDPCYSISGNLKAIIAEQDNLKSQVQDVNETRNKKGSAIPKLSFSFSFPGLRGKNRNSSSSSHDNFSAWKASPSHDVKDKQASTPKSSRNPKLCRSPETQRSSMSRIHPFNHCSACSAYTIFFKCHCLVCGRLYCSSCAKERMEELLNGRKCKESCQSGALRKRLSRNVRSRCWPFCSSIDTKMLQLYSSAENHA